jgi:hypothetical protein
MKDLQNKMNMKKIIESILLILILLNSVVYSQSAKKTKLTKESFRGVWQSDEDLKSFFIINGDYQIWVYNNDGNIIISYSRYGFISAEDNDKYRVGIEPNKCLPVKNVKDSGEFLIVYMDEKLPEDCLDKSKTLYYDYEIDEPYSSNIEFIYLHFLHYTRVNALDSITENHVLKSLKDKELVMPGNYIYSDWRHYGKVIKDKIIIYLSPTIPTKMYLIKEDAFKIIEENENWAKIEFFGKKVITGWLKKEEIKIIK